MISILVQSNLDSASCMREWYQRLKGGKRYYNRVSGSTVAKVASTTPIVYSLCVCPLLHRIACGMTKARCMFQPHFTRHNHIPTTPYSTRNRKVTHTYGLGVRYCSIAKRTCVILPRVLKSSRFLLV